MSSRIRHTWELTAKNLASHKNLKTDSVLELKANELVLLGNNGTGKSSISRAFRVVEWLQRDPQFIDPRGPYYNKTPDNLISINEQRTIFKLNISDEKKKPFDCTTSLTLTIKRGMKPQISSSSESYKFHVFNKDFVDDSIAQDGYDPSKNQVQGTISIGTGTAQTQHKELVLKDKKDELSLKQQEVEKAIEDIGQELKDNKCGSIRNHDELNVNSVLAVGADKSEYRNLLDKLKSMSQLDRLDSPSVEVPTIPCLNARELELIKLFLSKPHTKENIRDEVRAKINRDPSWVTKGFSYYKKSGSNECPFCGQAIATKSAVKIINEYEQFCNSEESKIKNQCYSYISTVDSTITGLNQWSDAIQGYKRIFDVQKIIVPDFTDESFDVPDVQTCTMWLTKVKTKLENKENDISSSIALDETEYAQAADSLSQNVEDLQKLVAGFEDKKSKLNDEIKEVKRQLWAEANKKIAINQKSNICGIKRLRLEIQNLNDEIEKIKAQSKLDKAELSHKILNDLVEKFFGDKYTLSADNKINLAGNPIEPNNILSDGEKSVLAFCWYVADTVNLIDKPEDLDHLYYIIDDPISSMDYAYVYRMFTVIVDLKRYIGEYFPDWKESSAKKPTFFILTHNIDFYNLFTTYNPTKNFITFLEFDSKQDATAIKEINAVLLSSVYMHLKDVYRVAKGLDEPSYTTGNSIRHITEWMWHLRMPGLSTFKDYVNAVPKLQQSSQFYRIANDLSHKDYVLLSKDEVSAASELAVEHVNEILPGQIEQLNKKYDIEST